MSLGFTTGDGKLHISKASSLAQFSRKPSLPLSLQHQPRESEESTNATIIEEKQEKFNEGVLEESGRLSRKEKLKQTLQRHS